MEGRGDPSEEGSRGFLPPPNTHLFSHPPLCLRDYRRLNNCFCLHGGKQVLEVCNQHSLNEEGKLVFQ